MSALAKHQSAPSFAIEVVVPFAPETLWRSMMRKHRSGRAWTAHDVCTSTGADLATVEDYLLRLTKANIIETADTHANGQQAYRIVTAVGMPPRLNENGSVSSISVVMENLWRSMKMLKSFTFADLVTHAHTDEHPVPMETARIYFSQLVEAEFLLPQPGRKAANEDIWQARFRVRPDYVMGPLPPRLYAMTVVLDPNTENLVSKRPVAREVQL
jgi:hypothetical protein